MPRVTDKGKRAAHTADSETTLPEIATVHEVADYLQIPVTTIHRWRARGKGPRAFMAGRLLRYRRSDVFAWIEAQPAQREDDQPW